MIIVAADSNGRQFRRWCIIYDEMPAPPDVLRDKIVPGVLLCARTFQLALDQRRIGVALSGGKDSLTLAIALREIGADVTAFVVDLGYAHFEAEAVTKEARAWGLRPVVLDARIASQSSTDIAGKLAELLDPTLKTPCSLCSVTKRILLVAEAQRHNLTTVAFGHHREDLNVTFLKDFFVSEYYLQYGAYDSSRFAEFVEGATLDTDALRAAVSARCAATMGIKVHQTSVMFIRPLAFVPEEAIESFVSTCDARISGSGCSHDVFAGAEVASASKREIVHRDLRRRLALEPALGDRILGVALQSVDRQGYAKFNPRAARAARMPSF